MQQLLEGINPRSLKSANRNWSSSQKSLLLKTQETSNQMSNKNIFIQSITACLNLNYHSHTINILIYLFEDNRCLDNEYLILENKILMYKSWCTTCFILTSFSVWHIVLCTFCLTYALSWYFFEMHAALFEWCVSLKQRRSVLFVRCATMVLQYQCYHSQ